MEWICRAARVERLTWRRQKWSAQLNINFLCQPWRRRPVRLVSRRRRGVAAAGAVPGRHLNPIHGREKLGGRISLHQKELRTSGAEEEKRVGIRRAYPRGSSTKMPTRRSRATWTSSTPPPSPGDVGPSPRHLPLQENHFFSTSRSITKIHILSDFLIKY